MTDTEKWINESLKSLPHLCAEIRRLSEENDALRAQLKGVEIDQFKPLTLDELREAAETGDPVWLVGMEDGNGWVRIDDVYSLTIGYSRFGDTETWCFRKASYGVRVWAYRQKP